MEWKPVDSIKQLLKMVDEVSRDKRRMYTNFICWQDVGNMLFSGSVPLFSRQDDSLYIINRKNTINTLYYWSTEVPRGRFKYHEEVVCEILERRGREQQQDMIKYLKESGFIEYAKYFEWKCADEKYKELWKIPLEYSDDPDINEAFRIYDIFDIYSDALPAKDLFAEYYKKLDSIFLMDKDRCAAFLFYDKKRCSVREEWLWVDKEYRMSGYAVWMLRKMINNCLENRDGNINHFSWINENNKESVFLHSKIGMEKTLKYKTTLILR